MNTVHFIIKQTTIRYLFITGTYLYKLTGCAVRHTLKLGEILIRVRTKTLQLLFRRL